MVSSLNVIQHVQKIIHVIVVQLVVLLLPTKTFNVFHTCVYLQGSGGITIKKTGQALIFGIYDEPLTPGQCNMIVERLGDYLIEQGM